MGSLAKFIAAIVSAICTISIAKGILLWLAGKEVFPDRWVNSVIGLAEEAVRANPSGTWILLGLAGLLGLAIGPGIYNFGITKVGKKSQRGRQIEADIGVTSRIALVDLCKLAADKDWKFTAERSQHVFDFVRTFRDAGSTGAVQFWGREKQRIDSNTREKALEEIPSTYWRKFKLDGLSLLNISPKTGEANGIETDNFQTVTVADGNLTQRRLYADIHLDRESAINWLANEGTKRRGGY